MALEHRVVEAWRLNLPDGWPDEHRLYLTQDMGWHIIEYASRFRVVHPVINRTRNATTAIPIAEQWIAEQSGLMERVVRMATHTGWDPLDPRLYPDQYRIPEPAPAIARKTEPARLVCPLLAQRRAA